MARSIFYLNFKSRPDLGRIRFIAEPVGFDSADFAIIQDDGRMGVDTLFAGGTGKFQFSKMAHPEIFEPLQNTIETQGFEGVVDLEIDYNSLGSIIVIGNLDLFTSDNNTYGLIKTDVILGQEFSKIKKNIEANVNVFSSLDIMRNSIIPVQKKKILIPPLPLYQVSSWESTTNTVQAIANVQRNVINPSQILVTRVGANNGSIVKNYGINDTLSFFALTTALNNQNGGIPNLETFTYLEFRENASKLKIKITEINGLSKQNVIQSNIPGASQILTGNGKVAIEVRVGFDLETATVYTLWSKNHNYTRPLIPATGDSQQTAFPPELTFELPFVERNKRVWIYINPSASATMSDGSGTLSRYATIGLLTSWKIQATVTLTSYATVNDGLRLIDVVKYVAKSAGLANVSFPRAEQGGYLYDQFFFDGNLLRNLIDKPFNVTWKYITECFPEQHLDYEIQNDGSIFIGNDEDFIANKEMYVCEKMVFEGYSDNFNPEFGLNLYEFKFDNYQSQKENDTENTYDEVHGELQYKSPNENVTGTKEVNVAYSRSPFVLEALRIKAFRTATTTASSDDDKKILLDVYPKSRINQSEFMFTETDLLRHNFDTATQKLILTFATTENGTSNWSLLGIKAGYNFRITINQINQGSFIVFEVGTNSITLTPIGSGYSSSNDGVRITNFQYFIKTADIEGVGWTNQDFTQIEGVLNAESFLNLRFTTTRNTLNNWQHHLATANQYQVNKPYNNTLYKNNPNLITTIYGVTVKEGQNFIPKNPLLSPKIVTVQFLIEFDKYYELMQKVRSYDRGYIRAFDAYLKPIKLYVKNMKFRQSASTLGTVTLVGKKKYDISILDINTNQSNDFISLNNGEYLVKKLIYDIKDNYFYIKDQNGKLMYDRLAYNNISFNGSLPSNQSQLINWLNPIT